MKIVYLPHHHQHLPFHLILISFIAVPCLCLPIVALDSYNKQYDPAVFNTKKPSCASAIICYSKNTSLAVADCWLWWVFGHTLVVWIISSAQTNNAPNASPPHRILTRTHNMTINLLRFPTSGHPKCLHTTDTTVHTYRRIYGNTGANWVYCGWQSVLLPLSHIAVVGWATIHSISIPNTYKGILLGQHHLTYSFTPTDGCPASISHIQKQIAANNTSSYIQFQS